MYSYLIRRLLWAIPVLLGITFTIHTVLSLTPGDPARIMLGETATEDQIRAARIELGLDRPFLQRYVHYIGDVLQGDLGRSFRSRRPVTAEIADTLPATAKLAGVDRKSTRLNSSHVAIAYAVFCLQEKS